MAFPGQFFIPWELSREEVEIDGFSCKRRRRLSNRDESIEVRRPEGNPFSPSLIYDGRPTGRRNDHRERKRGGRSTYELAFDDRPSSFLPLPSDRLHKGRRMKWMEEREESSMEISLWRNGRSKERRGGLYTLIGRMNPMWAGRRICEVWNEGLGDSGVFVKRND